MACRHVRVFRTLARQCATAMVTCAMSLAATAAAAPAFAASRAANTPGLHGADGVEPLVHAVSDDTLFASVVGLESFLTRRADRPEAAAAAAWMASRMAQWGADSVFVHQWASAYAPNVVGVRRGLTRPHRIVLVGGHYDSITPIQAAPGADDNASGTACVLECARVLCSERFEYTLQFVAFSAEELGLIGSNAYSAHLAARGDTLVAMLNVDMIGYLAPRDRRDVDIIFNAGSQWLRDVAVQTTAQYVPDLPAVDGAYRTGRSDQESFWLRGYSAISFFEDSDSPSPFIHTGDDVIGTSFNDLPLATACTRAAVALLATLARPISTPVAVQHLSVQHSELGNTIEWRLAAPAAWSAVRVLRAGDGRGPWVDATPAPLRPAAAMQFVDRDAHDALWYRLALTGLDGALAYSTPVGVDAPARVAFASLLPPIDRGDVGVDVRWSIGGADRATLAIFDARGRRVRMLAAGPQSPGAHLSLVRRFATETLILDGEIVAHDDEGRPVPFQDLMSRFATAAAPDRDLHVWFFDLLFAGGEPLVDRPYRERRALLELLVPESSRIASLRPADAEAARALYDEALARGHEGVLLKALDSPYAAGRRGSQWLKVKPAITLDLVILAAEWGHGRRRGLLSNLHLGARIPDSPGQFAMLGKTFKGLTDAMLREMTAALLELAVEQNEHVVHVRPERVIEIAFDTVQRSPRYDSGLALRFARVKRFRPDRTAADAATLDDVRAIHAHRQRPGAGRGDSHEDEPRT